MHQGTEGQIHVLPVDSIRVWQKVIKTEPTVQISTHKHDIQRCFRRCNKIAQELLNYLIFLI